MATCSPSGSHTPKSRSGNNTPLPLNTNSNPVMLNGRRVLPSPLTSTGKSTRATSPEGGRLTAVSEAAALFVSTNLRSTSSSPSLKNASVACRSSSHDLIATCFAKTTTSTLLHPTAVKPTPPTSLPTSPVTITASSCPSTTFTYHAFSPPSHHVSTPLFSSHPDLSKNEKSAFAYSLGKSSETYTQSLGNLHSVHALERFRRASLSHCDAYLSSFPTNPSAKAAASAPIAAPSASIMEEVSQEELLPKLTASERISFLFEDPADLDFYVEQKPVKDKEIELLGPVIDCKEVLKTTRFGNEINNFQVSLREELQSKFDAFFSSIKPMFVASDEWTSNMRDLVAEKNETTQSFQIQFAENLGNLLLSHFKKNSTFSKKDFKTAYCKACAESVQGTKHSDLLNLSFEAVLKKLGLNLDGSSYTYHTISSWRAAHILNQGEDKFIVGTKSAIEGNLLLEEDASYLASLPATIRIKFPFPNLVSKASHQLDQAKKDSPKTTHQKCLRLFVYLVSNQSGIDLSEIYEMFVRQLSKK